MTALLRIFLLVTGLMATSVASAVEIQTFSSEELRERYLELLDELRCPQCQNQNLHDSDSPIAQDLRRTVVRMLEAGKTDKEITDYLIDRYGDFITYLPRFKKSTYLLWLSPAVLLLIALVVVILVVRRQRSRHSDGQLSEQEQQRLNALLNGETKDNSRS
ncbi:cytochrome c-type biogenesis protein CcmH [Porticoccaceae bacterium LTM1]|nr:cytochrome c-type biogenesis protein CcmH [Porticoccaceae bacterium LTM1]